MREADVEKVAIELLEEQGYTYLSPEQHGTERQNPSEVVLRDRLTAAVDNLNPGIPRSAKRDAVREVLNLPHDSTIENNRTFHQMLIEGVPVQYRKNDETISTRVSLINFENPFSNEFLVCNQFTVSHNNINKRPDAVLFVNGFPFVVIELKNPSDEKATVEKAFDQLQNYKETIPALFDYNGVLVASDGLDAKAGSLTAGWSRFMRWKTIDGESHASKTAPQMETLICGMLHPDVLLDLIRYFTVFEQRRFSGSQWQTESGTEKKIAAYHQYYAVKKAIKSTIRASAQASRVRDKPERYGLVSVADQPKGDRKAGVVWHTQGSGKSLSMVFYAGLLVVNQEMGNPTIVVLTDRNDLDSQLFEAFAAAKHLLRQDPVQARNRAHLKDLLKTSAGGVVFSTIQKFLPEDGKDEFDLLSERRNIVVIADEAHRSQYGFGARTHFVKNGVRTVYGFAKYVRDALPEASFIGFTATPLEKEDVSTPAVFGNYIDIYDMEQAVEDGATVPIYYESRLVNLHLKEEERDALDAELEAITEAEEPNASETVKAKFAKHEAIVGHQERVAKVAADILEHFEERQEVFAGKSMIVATSRRIAVSMYKALVALRPDWHHNDRDKGAIKIVMTSSSSDPAEWEKHATTKQERKQIEERFKNPGDPLQIVIVRDMWLTGFDAPCLDTIYVDKIMRGHNLMQAIARVNRVYLDKRGGLIVDYIGIASDLRGALATYTRGGGRGSPTLHKEKAISTMLELYEIVVDMFHGFDYKRYLSADNSEKLTLILEAQEHILALPDGKEKFVNQVLLLSKAFALSVPDSKAMEIKAEVGFFQVVKSRLVKFETGGNGKSSAEIETAIRQIVDRAVVVGGVINIFDAAGIKKPDISILSDDFLEEIKGMTRKNLALELLKKILNDEIKTKTKRNLVQSRQFSEMLQAAITKYKNNLLTTAEVIEELISLARDIREAAGRAGAMGLSEDEIAFYDALAMNESAREVMGDDTLRNLARILVEQVKRSTSIDWAIKESVRARLRVNIKRLLDKYGYPPDKQEIATDTILKQVEATVGASL